MPTPDYNKSCIYMLRHKDDTKLENVYIGSTTNFKGRKHNHKTCSCNPNSKEYNYKKYQCIRDNGGWEEWRMIWLEDYPCKTLRELQLRENEVMLQYENRLNDRRASRTQKEYRKDYEEFFKERIKKYYEDNKQYFAEYNKEYRKNNKEKIEEHKKEKIKCNICGCESTRCNLPRHQRSKKCQSHLTNS